MHKYHPDNELIKRKYCQFMQYSQGKDRKTIDKSLGAISRFEECNNHKAFKLFHTDQAIKFQDQLNRATNPKGALLSKATIRGYLSAIKRFFRWLSEQQGYKSRLKYSDAEYFNQNRKDAAIAMARGEKSVPSNLQILHVIKSMANDADIAKRDRAMITLCALTGIRIDALRTLKLKHIDIVKRRIFQDAREVNTKFSKTFFTVFVEIDASLPKIIEEYVAHLKTQLLFSPDDPLFPAPFREHQIGSGFTYENLSRDHWKTTQPIRNAFRAAFESAGIPYYNPHSFRDMLTNYAVENDASSQQLIALARNFGQSNLATMLNNYGSMSDQNIAEVIRSIHPS